MKRICHTIHRLSVLVALLAAVAGTGAQERVFADAVTDRYLEAYDLNDRKEYLDAYAAFGTVARMMDRAMDAAGITVAGLDDGEFRFPYWPAVKSRAEVAYKLGLYADMREVAGELREALATRVFGNEALTEGYEAELARVEGCMYFLAGDYRRSEERLQAALTPNAGFDHADAVRDDLAQLYYRQERYAEALAQLDSILAGRRFGTAARVQGSGQDRREIESQRALCLARMGRYADARKVMEEVVSFFRKENDSRMLAEALRKAAKVLMLEYDATGKYDARALAYYKEYLAVARKYVDRQFVAMSASQREQFWMAEQPFVTDCYRLEDKDPGLLYDVALFSKAVLLQMGRVFAPGMTERQRAGALSAVRVDWKKVRAALPASSAAVEFIAYGKAGKSRLGALVLGRKVPAPVFVEVGALDELTSLRLDGGTTVGEALASTEHEGKDLLYADSVLAGKIWNRQLVEALDGAASVYFAADGIFHLLAVEYLLPDALKDRKFYRLTSTRMLVEKRPAVRTEAMLLCGGVDYKTADDGGGTEGNDEVAYAAMAAAGAGLPYLEGSLAEVDSIAALRGEGKRDTLLTDVSASEAAVRRLMGEVPSGAHRHARDIPRRGDGRDRHPASGNRRAVVEDLPVPGGCGDQPERQGLQSGQSGRGALGTGTGVARPLGRRPGGALGLPVGTGLCDCRRCVGAAARTEDGGGTGCGGQSVGSGRPGHRDPDAEPDRQPRPGGESARRVLPRPGNLADSRHRKEVPPGTAARPGCEEDIREPPLL